MWEFLSTALWKYNVQDLKVEALVAGVLRSLKCGGIWSGDSVCRLYAKEREALWSRGSSLCKRIVKENPAVCLLESIGRGRLSSGRPIKRACGLCAGLTGAPMEVKLNGLCGFSNPDYPYVNCCGLLQALVKK